MNVELSADLKRTLVKKAEDILDRAKIKARERAEEERKKKGWEKPKSEDKDDFHGQTAQLRNMLQIAQAESEIPVLVNFIHYQAGRQATGKFWSLIDEPTIAVLEKVIGTQAALADQASRRLAVQSFFGYMVRHYVYLTGVSKKSTTGGAENMERGADRASR